MQNPPDFISRKKVPLGPGYSLMDWMNLCNSGKDLAGTGVCFVLLIDFFVFIHLRQGGMILKVTMSEVKKHNREDDAWMVLRGKV